MVEVFDLRVFVVFGFVLIVFGQVEVAIVVMAGIVVDRPQWPASKAAIGSPWWRWRCYMLCRLVDDSFFACLNIFSCRQL